MRFSGARTPVAVVFFCFTAIAGADTLTLRNGQAIEGTYLGGTSRQVRMEVNGEIRNFDVERVQSVFFASQEAAPPAAQPQQQGGIVVPADTMVTVRMVDSVNSDTARTGQTFMASLDEPIVVNGTPVIQRGADVMTKLVYDEQAGKMQGRTVLTLALVSVKVDGRWVDLTSSDVRTESGSQGQKTGKIVGGTAALGAILGGIVGGGKGAAVGAVSGGAVGAGAAVATSGEKVTIPSETRLTFTLKTPAQL
jgi:hypothetical protein